MTTNTSRSPSPESAAVHGGSASSGHEPRPPRPGVTVLGLLVLWAMITVPVSAALFLHSSAITEVAGHTATVTPTLDGYASLDLGPYLPAVRYPAEGRLGAHIDLGSTAETSYSHLLRRYATLAAEPQGQIAKITDTLQRLAVDSAVTAGLLASAAPGLWLLLGRRRRTQLAAHPARLVAGGTAAVLILAVALGQPWQVLRPSFTQPVTWQPLAEALPGVPLPAQAEPLQVQAGLMTRGTRRLVESALDTYTASRTFYADLASKAASLGPRLRQPRDGETVAVLVSDRHDNIGMDRVAAAIGGQAQASMLLDAGDDTSTGNAWEAFSLDSLHQAFTDLEHRYVVAGNHDHGSFVGDYLTELGFTHLDGELVDGPDGIRLLGVDDPRSSGLGSWRDEPGMTFSEHEQAVADLACRYDADGKRVSTLLVHDANTGREALTRGCVDLVVGGHLHVQQGPTRIDGLNARVGYRYTNGTTGGAAYALALGSKLRRPAQVTLITYAAGRPVGMQPVTISTIGEFDVADYRELHLD